jgi:hypothetical protein
MQESLLSHPSMVREMNPERVLIVQHQSRCNKLAILLSVDSRSKEKLYKILLLVSGVFVGIYKFHFPDFIRHFLEILVLHLRS